MHNVKLLGSINNTVKLKGPVAINSFSPATLSLTGWFKDYPGSAPWTGSASAGNSGSHNLVTRNVDPSAGATLNGHNTADFNGTTQDLNSSVSLSSLIGSSGTIIYLLKTRTAAAPAGSGYSDVNLLGIHASGSFEFSINSTGPRGWIFDLASGFDDNQQTASLNAFHLVQFRFNTTLSEVRVDSSAWNPVTINGGGRDQSNDAIIPHIGTDWLNSIYLDGIIPEIIITNSKLTDTDCNNIKGYINTRYALSL